MNGESIMGLDVSFNTKKALEAGLVIKRVYECRAGWRKNGYIGPDVILDVLEVPGTDICVEADVMVENIVVRANKWGRVYEPLTYWLKTKDIAWAEF
jgi:hypothetical protein